MSVSRTRCASVGRRSYGNKPLELRVDQLQPLRNRKLEDLIFRQRSGHPPAPLTRPAAELLQRVERGEEIASVALARVHTAQATAETEAMLDRLAAGDSPAVNERRLVRGSNSRHAKAHLDRSMRWRAN
jgi:hypothetical protein